ncbi:MarR family winged helix-turn-helix transcriptional regulator [Pseudoxanthomonas sp. PXM01]|uniref:MarR family winged helix-turn-helix transcriptional regulator n=1 Tax=Pseudoxanthomonas sp. PXM01 TaxID=2769295 RepID=UPI00177F48C0|nr:MarR family winged helix-turn-helix transcriptional regulator [Pseudoxanthomonas sp. PXM01]MBD9469670.1 winged helix-turn-helix transcriptional regulator [Pseudoxanthomonas sp. PXM01]
MTPPAAPVTPSLCTCFRLRRASRRVTQVYDHELAAVGLSLNQYSILRRTERESRVLGGLADELGMDRTTLTRNLSPLVDAGLVETVRGRDARQRMIGLTQAGRDRLAAAKPYWRRAQDLIDTMLGETGIQTLHGDLDRLDERLRQHLGEAP